MTIEFWPPRLLRPRPRSKRPRRKPKPRRPKLPITEGKAQQVLSSAILIGDHELASWVDNAVKTGRVTAKPTREDLQRLTQRLDTVMEPIAG